MSTQYFYPLITRIIRVENLPENLIWLKEPLGSVLDRIDYKSLVLHIHSNGSFGYCSITLV